MLGKISTGIARLIAFAMKPVTLVVISLILIVYFMGFLHTAELFPANDVGRPTGVFPYIDSENVKYQILGSAPLDSYSTSDRGCISFTDYASKYYNYNMLFENPKIISTNNAQFSIRIYNIKRASSSCNWNYNYEVSRNGKIMDNFDIDSLQRNNNYCFTWQNLQNTRKYVAYSDGGQVIDLATAIIPSDFHGIIVNYGVEAFNNGGSCGNSELVMVNKIEIKNAPVSSATSTTNPVTTAPYTTPNTSVTTTQSGNFITRFFGSIINFVRGLFS